MRNCFLCNERCASAGIDGNWVVDCPFYLDEPDEYEERNMREYEDEMMMEEEDEEFARRRVRLMLRKGCV